MSSLLIVAVFLKVELTLVLVALVGLLEPAALLGFPQLLDLLWLGGFQLAAVHIRVDLIQSEVPTLDRTFENAVKL